MTKQEFLEYKDRLPYYNNDRAVRAYRYGTKGADLILDRASRNEGATLWDVYTHPSELKQSAFRECLEMFINEPNAEDFHICSHNCQNFSVAWSTPTTVVFLTRATENIVVF